MDQRRKPAAGDNLLRAITIEHRAASGNDDETFTASISSEDPYRRWWGYEILDHSEGAINLVRAAGGLPLLFGHDGSGADTLIGRAENVRIERRRLKADLRFFSDQQSQLVAQKVREGHREMSIGYSIDEMKLEKAVEGEDDTYRVTKWTPFEASIVSVPADPSVGVGRQYFKPAAQPAAPAQKGAIMQEQQTAAAGATAENRSADVSTGVDFAAQEKARKETIKYVCARADIPEGQAAQWILEGVAVEEAQRRAMEVLAERHKDIKTSAANVGLSARETQQYSLFRMIEAVANQNPAKAGLEFEIHQAMQAKLNRLPNERSFFLPSNRSCTLQPLDRDARDERRTFYVPAEVLQRDLTVGTANAGGYLVETANQGFIELLRNRSVTMRLGATRLTGLVGSITVPKQTAAATAYWLTNEATSITESTQTLGQLALAPKNVGAYTEISRQLLLQSSPSAEAMVMNDLARVIALAVDVAALEGSGSGGQPTGIANTASIGSVSGSSLAAAGILEFQSDVASGNVVPIRPGYVTTPAVAALLMARPELPSTGTTRLWTGNLWDGQLFNLAAMSSNQLTAATMIFGDWAELVVAEWGVLEVEVNPFANFQAGIRGVRCMYTVDVGVRYASAFSRATSIT